MTSAQQVRPVRLALLARRVDALVRAEAVEDGDNELARRHDEVRDRAKRRYDAALLKGIAVAEAAALHNVQEEDKRKRKRRQDDAAAAMLLFLYWAAQESFHALDGGLAGLLDYGATLPAKAPKMPLAWVAEARAKAEAFAESRRSFLTPFAREVQDAMAQAVEEGRAAGEEGVELRARLDAKAQEILESRGELVAQTESQVAYGTTQNRLLQSAGFTHKLWQTMEDERVRESHQHCQAQGPIPLDEEFSNGLMYPGDPNGDVANLANCRCWLVGVMEGAA